MEKRTNKLCIWKGKGFYLSAVASRLSQKETHERTTSTRKNETLKITWKFHLQTYKCMVRKLGLGSFPCVFEDEMKPVERSIPELRLEMKALFEMWWALSQAFVLFHYLEWWKSTYELFPCDRLRRQFSEIHLMKEHQWDRTETCST